MYLLTIGEEQPGSGLIPDLDDALERARVLSSRAKDHLEWGQVDICVWRTRDDIPDPTGDVLVARFEDGRRTL